MTARTPHLRHALALLGVAALLCISACGGSTAGTNTHSTTVHVRLYGGDWTSLNPAAATDFGSENMLLWLYDRLIAPGSNGHFLPELAKSWTVTPTGATFHLVSDARCDDGTPVTASVIKQSFDFMLAPSTADSALTDIFGNGTPTISADDSAATLTISLSKPYGSLLLGLSSVFASIICPAGVRDPALMKTQAEGSGSFVLTALHRGSSYVLAPHKGYTWGAGGYSAGSFPYKAVDVEVVTNETTAASELLSGELTLGNVAGPDVSRVKNASSFIFSQTPIPGSDILAMNETPGHPGTQEAVRGAIFSLLDRHALDEAASDGIDTESTTMMSPTTADCYSASDGSPAVAYDPQRATQLLESAGYHRVNGTWSKDGRPLSVGIIFTTGYASAPDYVESTLANFGIKATVATDDINAYFNVLFKTGAWDLTYYPLPGPFASVENLASQLSGTPGVRGGGNFADINNPAFNADAAQANQLDGQAACRLWDAAERTILSRADIWPVEQEDIDWFSHGVSFDTIAGVLLNLNSLKPS